MKKLNYQKPTVGVSKTYSEGYMCTGTIPIPGSGTVVNPWAKEGIEEEGDDEEPQSVWDE